MFQTKNKIFSTFSALALILSAFNTFSTPALAANPLVGQESTIIARTNAIRSARGLDALRANSKLTASARAKAVDMATKGYFGHANPSGFRMSYWIKGQGYSYELAGENLAKGFTDLDRLMNAWVASPTHYANLVEPRFQEIGIGIAEGTYQGKEMVFVVQHFGDPVVVPVAKPVVAPVPAPAPVVTEPAPAVVNPAPANNVSKPVVPTAPAIKPQLSNLVIVPAAQAAEVTAEEAQPISEPTAKEKPSSLGILLMLITLAAVGHTIDEATYERIRVMALTCKNCALALHKRAQEALA